MEGVKVRGKYLLTGRKETIYKRFYHFVIFLCFLPFLSPAIALFAGLLFSLFGFRHATIHRFTSPVLQLSIVLMGFGMSLNEVITASKTGFVTTAISVVSVMLLGILLGKLFRVEKNITLLIATGTAICGGECHRSGCPHPEQQELPELIRTDRRFRAECRRSFHLPVCRTGAGSESGAFRQLGRHRDS